MPALHTIWVYKSQVQLFSPFSDSLRAIPLDQTVMLVEAIC